MAAEQEKAACGNRLGARRVLEEHRSAAGLADDHGVQRELGAAIASRLVG